MLKLLLLVFDLLDITVNESVEKIAEILMENPQTKLFYFWEKGFVFDGFQQFLLGKISQEDFIALGDSFGYLQDFQINPNFDLGVLVYGLKNDAKQFQNSIVIMSHDNNSDYKQQIESLKTILNKHKIQIFYL